MVQPRFYPTQCGWVVDTPISLNKTQLEACIKFVKKTQIEKIRGMGPGEKRAELERVLALLTSETVKQNVLPAHPWEKDRIIF